MKTYLVSKYTSGRIIDGGNTFTCLYEIDPNDLIDMGKGNKIKSYRILNVIVGNDKIKYVKKTNAFGNEFYLWSWKDFTSNNGAYYRKADGFELFEMDNHEQALLYYKLNY
jgi:hypothetical protein